MSFSSRAKEEMTVKLPKQKCCEKARIFGILLFSGGFTRSGISVTTEIAETIELVRRFFSETFGDEGKTETVASKSGKALRFSVNDNNTVEAAFAYFGIGEDDMMDDIFRSLRKMPSAPHCSAPTASEASSRGRSSPAASSILPRKSTRRNL